MGMSATQARFLCLTARKSNVEFEGQQINQQRTTLSNESASYYSELCNMEVPTPPSVDDYTKISYSFDDGSMTNTITSILAKPDASGNYAISYLQQWQDDYSIVPASSSLVQKAADGFYIGTNKLREIGILGNYSAYVTESGEDSGNINEILSLGDEEFEQLIGDDPYLKSLNRSQVVDLLREEAYFKAMLNDYKNDSQDWQIRYVKNSTTGDYEPSFYPIEELQSENKYHDNLANISCFTLGSATKTKEVLNQEATIEKNSAGRYIAITFLKTDENGNKIPDKTYNLTTTTETDEEAYNDAMNQYHYKQARYDQKIQDINSKLEIVQQQDKALELKLKQLDTEENAISTEMDAVKKVISKNVESSFKTFNA